MRERLVAAFIILTVVVIAMFSVVRAYATSDLVRAGETEKVERTAVLLAEVLDQREELGKPITSAYLSRFLRSGDQIVYGGSAGPDVRAATKSYTAGPDDVTRSRHVTGGGTVTVNRSADEIRSRVAGAVLPIVLLAAGLIILAGIGGWLAARRLARPFRVLAHIADDFGRGRFDVEIPHFAIPEAENVGQAMLRASAELRSLLSRERQFAVNASHLLRTPITALHLELEDVSLWQETPPAVRDQLRRAIAELDRLNNAVTDLLTLSRGTRLSETVHLDLTALVTDTVGRWRPQAEARGHRLVLKESGRLPIKLAPGPISQILDVLIENAIAHGEGVIRVEADSFNDYLRVQVADRGARTIGDDVFRRGPSGTGREGLRGDRIDLTVALEIAEALGGHLRLEPDAHTTFSLMLPKPTDPL
jgi:signal transduction histidine kinase